MGYGSPSRAVKFGFQGLEAQTSCDCVTDNFSRNWLQGMVGGSVSFSSLCCRGKPFQG